MDHRWELDALRGLMLTLMTLTHLPTRFSSPFGQPFGYVSAAEGFVMLSAYMAGMVYTLRQRRHGDAAMQDAFLARAWKIYLCQAALLLFAFALVGIAGLEGEHDAVKNLLSFYRERPLAAVFGAALLLYNPPLLDILPMYIVFMLVSPVLLLHGRRQGWFVVLGLSIALWFGAQFGMTRALHHLAVTGVGLPVPFDQIGAFDIFGWQLLWVLGLWLGSSHALQPEAASIRFPRWMVVVAAIYALVCFGWRHAVGQSPFTAAIGHVELNSLFDKWRLAPLRLLDFMALLLLTLHFGAWLKSRLPRVRLLELLGAASLPVFCTHLVLVLTLLAWLGEIDPQRPLVIDAMILVGSLCVLGAVAKVTALLDARTAAMRERVRDVSRRRRAVPPERRSRPRPAATSGR
jgi:hypothetical protein